MVLRLNNQRSLIIIIIIVLSSSLVEAKKKSGQKFRRRMSDEKLLTKFLLGRYEDVGVMGRPVCNSTSVMDVRFGISLIQILDLDAKNQVLTTNIWSRYTWFDVFMSWNPQNFGGLKQVRVPSSRIWTPDIVLYNYADTRLKEHRDSMLVISNNGSVLWIPPSIYKSTCKIDITHFPFDTQTCSLKFGSWTYDGYKLNVDFYRDEDEVDISDYVPSNEWGLIGYRANRHVRYYTCCNEPYPDLTFTLHLKRVATFYHYVLILPCVLLSSLTLVIFWLPPESPAKILLGMNIFVAFFVLLLLLADVTPPAVTRIPLIGAYFCLNMILITLSTFLAVVVINTYIRGDKTNRVPGWIRKIAIDRLANYLCMNEFQECSEKPAKFENIENGSKVKMVIFDLRKPSNETSPDLEMKVIKNCSKEEYKLESNAYNSTCFDNQQVSDGDYVTVALDRSFIVNNCNHETGQDEHCIDQPDNLNHIPKTWPMHQAAKSMEPIYDNIPFETNRHRLKPTQSSSDASSHYRSLNICRNTKNISNCDRASNQTNCSADLPAEFPAQNLSKVQKHRARKVKGKSQSYKAPPITKLPTRNELSPSCCECNPKPLSCHLPEVPCCLSYLVDSEYPCPQIRERQKKLRRDAREIKRLIRSYMKRFRTRDKTSKEHREWRIVARVMDRLFFITYIVIITTSLVGLLPKPEEFRF